MGQSLLQNGLFQRGKVKETMRFAFSLSLAALGVSYLLPSDIYKAALFVLCGAMVFLFMPEPELAMADCRGINASEQEDEDNRYDDDNDPRY